MVYSVEQVHFPPTSLVPNGGISVGRWFDGDFTATSQLWEGSIYPILSMLLHVDIVKIDVCG